MLIYNYNEITKEYTGYCEADLDPAESKAQGKDIYLIPANATDVKPPKAKTNEVVIYDNGWKIEADFRGKYIVNEDMKPEIVKEIGELPEGYIVITETQAKKIEQDPLYYIISDGHLIKNPNYDEEMAQQRKDAFLKDFFNVTGYGYYRKVPKGYQSAVESMNVLFNIANVTDGIQAGLIIFYQEPDFTKPEQCTEEWLIEHQIVMPAMSKVEFLQLYVAFMTAWNTEEHEVTIND